MCSLETNMYGKMVFEIKTKAVDSISKLRLWVEAFISAHKEKKGTFLCLLSLVCGNWRRNR